MSRIKEPNFFAYEGQDDDPRFQVHSRARHEARFAAARPDQAIGEASSGSRCRTTRGGRGSSCFRDDVLRLQSLIGRDPSSWPE
jgi:hypothetical protein